MRPFTPFAASVVVLITTAHSLVGQDPPSAATQQDPPAATQAPAQAATPTQLVFEREVFMYPPFSRRNPFAALVGSNSGPRFEQIHLRGIIHTDDPRGSVALLGMGERPDGAAQEEEGRGRDQTRRIRVGESWGNVRILEIRRSEILVQVEEFGLMEQRVMRLPTRARGES